ncbi:hypothetical protein DOY81_002579 [Sarcophaga bullata]|nr:hypothetical protein DOY81_002579 [Sarcophaga bullata]
MRYLYGAADEKHVKKQAAAPKKIDPLSSYKFFSHPFTKGKTDEDVFDKGDVPIVAKCTPDKLVSLCVIVVDAIPLIDIYKWTIEDICKWLRDIGFRQYQNTFRVNLIDGHKLLILDASALSAMNIKDFEHIKRLTYGIRSLFYFEMTKFGRSLTLYPEFLYELYKLFRIKTGTKYEIVRRSDLWRKMQLIRQKEPNYTHWEILERWLAFEKEPKELFGTVAKIDTSKRPTAIPIQAHSRNVGFVCIPACQCHWKESDYRPPWRFKCLPYLPPDDEIVPDCCCCLPPCTCRWSSKKYTMNRTLPLLKKVFPQKYGAFSLRSRLEREAFSAYRLSLF